MAIALASQAGRIKTSSRPLIFKNRTAAWIVLVTGLIITAAATFYMKESVDRIARQEFCDHCNEVQKKISDRLEDHVRILLGSAAFLEASEKVTREEWRFYIQSQKIETQLPGMQGIGFNLLIPRRELPAHIRKIRSDGFPSYKVHPDGDRELYTAIIYLEPLTDRNLLALGYDTFADPVRRAVMERARDTGMPAMSGKVMLVQETGKDLQVGFLIYVPVYRKGMPTETVEQRRAALYGWVSAPYRINDLMQGILGSAHLQQEKDIHFKIYDGDQILPLNLLYSCHSSDNDKLCLSVRFTMNSPIDSAGHRWTLRFTQTGGGLASVEYLRVWLTLAGGLIITLLLFVLIRTLQKSQAKALQLVEERTAELQQERHKLLEAQRIAHIGSWHLDIADNILSWSDEIYRIFGIPIGTPLTLESFINGIHPDDRKLVVSAWTAALSGAPYNIEHRICAGNQIRWVREQAEITFDEQGAPLFGIGTLHDITERLLSEKRFQTLFSQIPIPLSMADGKGAIIYQNQSFTDTFGYTLQELPTIERWMVKAYPDEAYRSSVIARWNAAVAAAVASRSPIAPDEYLVTCKDGTVRTVLISGAKLVSCNF